MSFNQESVQVTAAIAEPPGGSLLKWQGLSSKNAAMKQTIDHATKVAKADIAVMVSGESGTGKEVMARFIHAQSHRAEQRFVAINCAAIPENMLEAMLFGHERGAFTGAGERRIGKFEQAHNGTLLLDEITEMPTSLQSKILRVLQERELERLGGNKIQKVDVRVIATSNRDLDEALEQGLLREDLYYRLSVFPILIPPLRDRLEDLLDLAETFLAKYGQGETLSACAKTAICNHRWPGNVRELENAIQRGLVLANDGIVRAEDLRLTKTSTANDLQSRMQSQEDQVLLETLASFDGARRLTAEKLGISERTLRHKLKQMRERGVAV